MYIIIHKGINILPLSNFCLGKNYWRKLYEEVEQTYARLYMILSKDPLNKRPQNKDYRVYKNKRKVHDNVLVCIILNSGKNQNWSLLKRPRGRIVRQLLTSNATKEIRGCVLETL